MKFKTKKRHQRTGAAVIEMAICLPVLFLLVFGTVELTGSIFLKQTLTSAAHEGALFGMKVGSSEQDIIDRVELILEGRNLGNTCTVSVSPTGEAFDAMLSGDSFTVSVNKGDPNAYINISSVTVQVSTQRP